MKDNEKAYWRSEYENLRRKKNKQIDDLQVRMAKGSAMFLKFLQETNQLERYYEWIKKAKCYSD